MGNYEFRSRPYTELKTYPHDIGFEQTRVQFTPYYNLLFASLLAEDIYGRTQWRDWSSSEWCWGNEKKWRRNGNRKNNRTLVRIAQAISSACNFVSIRLDYYVEVKQHEWEVKHKTFPKNGLKIHLLKKM